MRRSEGFVFCSERMEARKVCWTKRMRFDWSLLYCRDRCLSSSSGRLGGGSTLGSGGGAILLTRDDLLILLTRAIDGDLDGNLTALDLLAIHLRASLLLQLLRSEGDKAKATALARLVAGLKLLDHEARDGPESDLGRSRRIVLEDLHKLQTESAMWQPEGSGCRYYLLLAKVVREVCDHDFGL